MMQSNFHIKDFYRRYTLPIWIGVAYVVFLALLGAHFFSIFFYTWILIFCGRLFYDFIGKKDFLHIWLLGVIATVVIYSLFASQLAVFPRDSLLSAALAGGVMALIAASATYMPNAPMRLFVLGPFPYKYLAIGLIILNVFNRSADTEAIGVGAAHFSHLMGAAAGFAFIYLRQQGYNTHKLFSWLYTQKKSKMKAKKGGRYQHKPPPKDDQEYNRIKVDKQKKTDAILDKISKSGYESLTKEEKEFLFKQSKE